MASIMGRVQRRLGLAEIGIDDNAEGKGWPAGEVELASVTASHGTRYLLTVPEAVIDGEGLTGFLARVAPFGCPPPHSLIRAYSLPDSPFPSILLKEHEEALAGVGDAYRRFVDGARQHWLGALLGTGPGLCPALAWQAKPARRFLPPDDEWVTATLAASQHLTMSRSTTGSPGRDERGGLGGRREPPISTAVADDYLGRALLLLAHPDLAASWQTMMSLGGVTKARKITGREFPVWVDLPAHQPDLLASPLLARVERLLAED